MNKKERTTGSRREQRRTVDAPYGAARDHLGHADPGFTARTYAHVMRDASKRRRVSISRDPGATFTSSDCQIRGPPTCLAGVIRRMLP